MFQKILIANRGEIAVRIIRTARRLGIATVAVYSDADRDALFVEMADEAVYIGPSAAAESYLRGEKILAAAERTGAQAIHPGYGFLSENAAFAKLCAKAGIAFIGPDPDAIIAMGSKSEAKTMMMDAGVPVAPGYQGADQSVSLFKQEAARIGYPVLLKANAGGGGKGMRLVEKEEELEEALLSAKREAKAAFGDDRFLIEKFIAAPRHVEVQVFGDRHGSVVHLFERDCSLQRRHQKVIEEAPAPDLSPDVRKRLHEAAIKAAKAVNYVGAGTVEFLFDGQDAIYFMEMNTRLQVEHPVTEWITGLDLVEWQLRVAAGQPLPCSQDEIICTGHAFEARIYAEDPDQDYRPSIGTLHRLTLPVQNKNVRLDSGVRQGDSITPYYDPMILKLITGGADRTEALARLHHSLNQTFISGVTVNTPLLARLSAHEAFREARIDTHFIEHHHASLFPSPLPTPEDLCLAGAAFLLAQEKDGMHTDLWHRLGTWRVNVPGGKSLHFQVAEETIEVTFRFLPAHTEVRVQDELYSITDAEWSGDSGTITLGGHRIRVVLHQPSGDKMRLWHSGRCVDLNRHDPMQGTSSGASAQGTLTAPMPGTITALPEEAGAKVTAGQTLLVMEAMKMEYAIKAPADGTVIAHRHQIGDQVAEGSLLVEFEAEE